MGAQIAKSIQQALSLTPAQAAGVVGNLIRESGLNPRINEGGAVGLPRGVGGYGLAQWTGSRQTDLVRFAGGAAAAGNLQTQLRFMVSELLGPESRALASLRRATSPEEAAVVFDRDYERSGIKALGERKANARRVFTEIEGTGPGAGLGDFASQLQDQAQAAQQLQEQQAAAQKQLEQFNEERAKTAVQLNNEEDLLRATTDEAKRRLEFEIEIDNITQQHLEKLQSLKTIEEEIARLGGVAETAAIREGLEREKEQQLALARLRAEQDLNEILVERQRMMQDLTRQASEPTVFNVLEQQKAQLDEILQRYPAIGQAADAAATLATNGMAEMIAGTKSAKEVFADFLQGIASALIDTAKKMIAQYIAIGIARMFAGIGGSAVGGFSGSSVGPFGAGGISPALSFPTTGFANGGIMSPSGPLPLKAYSRGGVASTPQVALFGEGSMNEAYVPLPDGRRIPVALQAPDGNRGDRMRELMGASPAGSNTSPVLSMSFETTTINGVEYVSRDQLESAMAETRKRAANDGAKRGMSMTLDRLQQSPATRSKVGIR
jgi:hypothetical protein